MTNAEKYLKDEVNARKFREKLAQFIFGELGLYDGTEEAIDEVIGDFLDMIEKPTLTEDERVILRNINSKYIDTIHRNSFGELILHYAGTDNEVELHYLKENLFQFIKERRRILY